MSSQIINGYIGGILNALIFIPQLYKIFITKSSIDISWTFIFLSIIACIFSMIYYWEIDALPMFYTNIFTLFSRFFLGCFKFYYDFDFFKKRKDDFIEETIQHKETLLHTEICL